MYIVLTKGLVNISTVSFLSLTDNMSVGTYVTNSLL